MREIKFRAWSEGKKEYGYFSFENFMISARADDVTPEIPIPYINTWRYKKGALGEMGMYFEFSIADSEIENYQYQQYTGLKDKNGVEIYEGDVVTIYSSNEDNEGNRQKTYPCRSGVINYRDGAFYIGNRGVSDRLGIYSKSDSTQAIEVIGNIYEHPELLNE